MAPPIFYKTIVDSVFFSWSVFRHIDLMRRDIPKRDPGILKEVAPGNKVNYLFVPHTRNKLVDNGYPGI